MTCETSCPKCGTYRNLVVRESYDYRIDEKGVAYSHDWGNPLRTVICLACGQDVTESFGVTYDEDGSFIVTPEHLKGEHHD